MAARLGIEPRQTDSESVVLPLHHRAVLVETRWPTVGGDPRGTSGIFREFLPGLAGPADAAGAGVIRQDFRGANLEPAVGFEPTTYGLQNRCTTTVLCWRQRRVGDLERTDFDLK